MQLVVVVINFFLKDKFVLFILSGIIIIIKVIEINIFFLLKDSFPCGCKFINELRRKKKLKIISLFRLFILCSNYSYCYFCNNKTSI